MKTKFASLILALITSFSFAYSDEPCYPEYYSSDDYYCPEYDYGVYDAYRYFSVGVGPVVFIPNLGVGYRERHCQLGWDANLSFSSIGYAHQVTGNVVGLYYFDAYAQNSPYVGLGLLGSGVFTNKKGSAATLSPDFVIGKEFERTDYSRHFIEMHIGVPTLVMGKRFNKGLYVPLMYIKYGISF